MSSTAKKSAIQEPSSQPDPRQRSVSDALACFLAQCGVERGYGLNGGAIAPFLEALARSPVRVLHMRHEAGAAFAALEDHFATGRPTLVFATSGPGLTNALTGMMAARWEGGKVIMISGGTAGPQRGRWPAQETSSYTMPISGLFTSGPLFHYAVTMESPAELDQICWRLAAGLAQPGPFVAHINIPIALQTAPAARAPQQALAAMTPPGCPPQAAHEYAARLASKPFAIWVGFGARHASRQILALAERTGAPVMCTPRAKGIFPEDHKQFIGVTGLGGHPEVDAYLSAYRPAHVLVLGSRLAETASFWQASMVPPEGFIHVDLDPSVPGAAFQTALTYVVQSDVGAFLDAILERMPVHFSGRAPLPKHAPPPALEPQAEGVVRPRFLFESIQRVVVEGSDAIVMAESGNSFAWAINVLRVQVPGRFRVSSSFGSMGHTVCGVVGAALARRGKAVAIVGDGSMLMNSEINAAVAYEADAVWIVLNDHRYGMVAQGMEAQGFTPVEGDFPTTDFSLIARGMGGDGVRVENEKELEAALQKAMAVRGPFVVDVVVDRSEPGPWMRRIQNLILQGAVGSRPKK